MSTLKATPYDIEHFLIAQGCDIRRRGRKAEIRLCPFCGGGEHRDLWKCVVYLDDTGGNFKCMRGSCGQAGSFWQLVEHFGEDPKQFYERDAAWTPAQRPTRQLPDGATSLVPVATHFTFTPPSEAVVNAVHPLTEKAVAYLQLRGITAELADELPVWCDDRGNVNFGYYHKGDLCMVKVRSVRPKAEREALGEPKCWQAWKGGLRPLWLLERCDPKLGPLVVVFGEYDALALRQARVQNVVSVPNGDSDLDWININWEELQRYPEIVLWPDNDKSGHEALLRISERLGCEKLRVVRSPHKDPNEHLAVRVAEVADEADEEIRELVRTAEWLHPGDLTQLADVVDEMQIFEGYTSGIAELDKLTGGYFRGQLILHFGDTKHGKSAGVNQIAAMAVEQGGRVCVWAGEDTGKDFRYKMFTHIAGLDGIEVRYSERTGTEYAYVKPEFTEAINNWVRDRMILLDPKQLVTIDLLLQNFTLAFQRFGCDTFIVDNLMKLVYAMTNGDNVLACQAKIVDRLSSFAKNHRVTVHLVSHTKKKQGGKDHEPPSRDENSGAKEIINLCDRAQYWWRVPAIAAHVYHTESVTGIVADRVWGNEGSIPVRYFAIAKRYGCNEAEIMRRYSLEGVYE